VHPRSALKTTAVQLPTEYCKSKCFASAGARIKQSTGYYMGVGSIKRLELTTANP
jgi:hypothetical protein